MNVTTEIQIERIAAAMSDDGRGEFMYIATRNGGNVETDVLSISARGGYRNHWDNDAPAFKLFASYGPRTPEVEWGYFLSPWQAQRVDTELASAVAALWEMVDEEVVA
jgi:hypothetical protein